MALNNIEETLILIILLYLILFVSEKDRLSSTTKQVRNRPSFIQGDNEKHVIVNIIFKRICLVFTQFYVDHLEYLNCLLDKRTVAIALLRIRHPAKAQLGPETFSGKLDAVLDNVEFLKKINPFKNIT